MSWQLAPQPDSVQLSMVLGAKHDNDYPHPHTSAKHPHAKATGLPASQSVILLGEAPHTTWPLEGHTKASTRLP